MTQPIEAVLFDLDGTLLDTAPDMAAALNAVRRLQNLPDLPIAEIRPKVGYGSKALLKLGFNMDNTHADYPIYVENFLTAYEQGIAASTQLFAGMQEVLTYLEEKNILWGIVTNKPARFTHALLDALQLSQRSACIISGDTLATCKPDPAPILHACQLLKKNPASTLYVGDAATDIIASKAAGTRSLAALYGYIGAEENPLDWQADGYIKTPEEIISFIF